MKVVFQIFLPLILIMPALAGCNLSAAVKRGAPDPTETPGAIYPIVDDFNFAEAATYSAANNGLAMLVMVDGKIVFEQYDNGHSADLPVHLHSATKSFWGVAVAGLVEDGLLSFDERVSDTIAEWRGDPKKNTITVRQLLNLTSGLGEDLGALQGIDGYAEDKYAFAIDLPVRTTPGEVFRYGPSHFYALGELLERKLQSDDISPLEYLQERILNPIGVVFAEWLHDPSGNVHIPNGAYLTARNWARFGLLILQGGNWEGEQIVSKELLDECFIPTQANPGYGLTFWLNQPGGFDPMGNRAPPGSIAGFIYPAAYGDLVGAMGAGKNRIYIIPSLNMVVVRQAEADVELDYKDAAFLGALFQKPENSIPQPPTQVSVERISPEGDSYIDPEILQSEGLMTFQQDGEIWVARLDPQDGSFISPQGHDYLMDSGAARPGLTFNGPEFGLDSNGWAVYYAKEDGDQIQIWRAQWTGAFAIAEPLTSGMRHQTQLITHHKSADTTHVVAILGDWNDGQGIWFDAASPTEEHIFTQVEKGVASVRWINDTFQLVFSNRQGSQKGQISWLDTGAYNGASASQVITNDHGDKTDPYGWLAPEHGGEPLVLAIVDNAAIGVYQDTGGTYWRRIKTLYPPAQSKYSFVSSAEPFIVNGKSYISLTIKDAAEDFTRFQDSEIWIFGIEDDPAEHFNLRCDDGTEPLMRSDPEVYIGDQQVFVYYNVLTPDRTYAIHLCRSGIAIHH